MKAAWLLLVALFVVSCTNENTDAIEPVIPDCVEEGGSLGATVPGNTKECCEGLEPFLPNNVPNTRGICLKKGELPEPIPEDIKGRGIAREFVLNSPTYKFDGSDLQHTKTHYLRCPNCYAYEFTFTSGSAGYGDRTGLGSATVMTSHTAYITVIRGEIDSAVLDNEWNMLTQQFYESDANRVQYTSEGACVQACQADGHLYGDCVPRIEVATDKLDYGTCVIEGSDICSEECKCYCDS